MAPETLPELVIRVDDLTDDVVNNTADISKMKVDFDSINAMPASPPPRTVVDPGVITIGGSDYKFRSLVFRVATASGLVKHYAEDVAADGTLASALLLSDPTVFIPQ